MDMNVYRKAVAAREEMLGMLNKGKRRWNNMACIAIVFEDSVHVSPNQACHAGLHNNYDGNKDKGALAVVSALMQPSMDILSEEEALMFLDWLLNRSPYASTFVTKSAHEAIYYKATISDAFTPSNLMAAGMVSSRRLWEYAFVTRVFCDLVKVGVNENLAYWLGHIAAGAFNRSGSFNWGTGKAGHCSVDTYISNPASLKAFLEHKPANLNKTYNESMWYNSYHEMFGEGTGGIASWIHDNFPYKAQEEVKKVNPFKKDVVDDKSCSYQYAIKTMATFQHTILEHIGYKA